jgi:hypothetical protein
MGWGFQYLWSSQQLREAWNLVASRLVDISRPDLRPWETHEGPRWWRDRRRGGRASRWSGCKPWRVLRAFRSRMSSIQTAVRLRFGFSRITDKMGPNTEVAADNETLPHVG